MRIQYKFGLSKADAERVAAITECENPRCHRPMALHIDHDHDSGVVRAVLCGPCNQALGLLRDRADVIRGLADLIEERTVAPLAVPLR